VARSVRFDEEIHENDPRRYMREKMFGSNGKTVSIHSMLWGSGVSMCEGRSVDCSLRLLVDLFLKGLCDERIQSLRVRAVSWMQEVTLRVIVHERK
jgi:hypothetical protein